MIRPHFLAAGPPQRVGGQGDAMAKILIADDHMGTRKVINYMLSDEGHQVVEADDGLSACAIAVSEKPDIILLDIVMPEMDGFEALGRLKDNPDTGSIPVIFVTAKKQLEDETKGTQLGAFDFISKPLAPGELEDRIRMTLSYLESQSQQNVLDKVTLDREHIPEATKVLVVKYGSRSRKSLVSILRRAGYDVVEADGTGASLKSACQERPDIVLLDVWTEPEDGFKTLVQLRGDSTTAGVPVVLLTGSSRLVGEQDAMRLGANHYLTMPWKPDMVEATIKVALSEPLIAADQMEKSLSAMRSRPHTNKRLQRADRRARAPYVREDDSLPNVGGAKSISPSGLNW